MNSLAHGLIILLRHRRRHFLGRLWLLLAVGHVGLRLLLKPLSHFLIAVAVAERQRTIVTMIRRSYRNVRGLN